MTRVADPPAVDLAKVGKGNAWHVVAGDENDGDLLVVKTFCGLEGPASGFEGGVDSRVVQHRGAKVCANCRTQHDLKTTHDHAGDEPEEESDMTATTTENEKAPEAKPDPKPSAKKNGAKPKATPAAKPATKSEIEKAIARAEKIIATQPARTAADLTPKQAEKAFKLGKAIAADRWLLKKAEVRKTSSATVAAMVERIEERVAERNALRAAK